MSTSTFGPRSFQLGTARRTAEKIVEELREWCTAIEIAGSIRRGRPFVGDIDIVLQPKDDVCRELILIRAGQSTKRMKAGDQYVVFEMATGLQLDLWFAHGSRPEVKDMLGTVTEAAKPGNFGMLLLTRTGSKEHNVHLAQVAKARGLHFSAHAGITRAGLVIASETEADVFKALGLPLVAPERRER